MAGSISLSLSQQFDSTGEPLNGGTLQFYAAGTTTPQSAYQDSSLTLPWPNPIVLDSAGRVPPFYLADGQIKIVLKDAAGVTQVSADNLLVVGASSGSGTAPTVDATTIFDVGDLKCKYSTSAITGWVRANGRTIGSATSGGTERANADCENLFLFLWAVDSSLSVSTGRGASAAADWAANKNIALPDWRGRVIAGFDDMGNSAANRLTTTVMTGSGIGGTGGTQTQTLTAGHIPSITSTVSVSSSLRVLPATAGESIYLLNSGNVFGPYWSVSSPPPELSASGTATSNNTGGAAHLNVQPTMFATIYIKL